MKIVSAARWTDTGRHDNDNRCIFATFHCECAKYRNYGNMNYLN